MQWMCIDLRWKETLRVRESVHGPVAYEKEGTTLAVPVAGLDRPFRMEQYWQMATARDFAGFKKAAARNQVPMYNVAYADRDGHIVYLFNETVPKWKTGDWRFWHGIAPGDTSETMWTEYHTYEELPKVIDPPAGYVQNTNDPPWNASWPQTLDPALFPAYMSPKTASFRNERSIRLMAWTDKLSFDEFVKWKHETRSELADRVLDELLAAVAVLKAWDRAVDAPSRGSIFFLYWAQRFMGPAIGDQRGFAVPYSMIAPLTTPRGLKDPARAVALLEATAGI